MSIDKIIFPNPKPQYTEFDIQTKDENSMIYFMETPSVKNQNEINKVPLMVMAHQVYEDTQDMYILFFHGNAEDLGSSLNFLRLLREYLKANIIAVEYPSYGIYKQKISAEQIKSDALHVYDSLIKMGIDQSKIIVFGRSIGTGPACEVGAKRQPGAVILLSAFTSIKKLAGEIAFKLVSYFVKERFNNIENVQQFNSPCLLIHGQADQLIKFEHTKQLQEALNKTKNIVKAVYPENMTHNQFKLQRDIIKPIEQFLRQISFCIVKIKIQNLPSIFEKAIRSYIKQSVEIQQIGDIQQIQTLVISNTKSQNQNNNNNQNQEINKDGPSNKRAHQIQKYMQLSSNQQNENIIQQIQVCDLNAQDQGGSTNKDNKFQVFTQFQQDSIKRKQQFEDFKINKEQQLEQDKHIQNFEMSDSSSVDDEEEEVNEGDDNIYHDGESKNKQNNEEQNELPTQSDDFDNNDENNIEQIDFENNEEEEEEEKQNQEEIIQNEQHQNQQEAIQNKEKIKREQEEIVIKKDNFDEDEEIQQFNHEQLNAIIMFKSQSEINQQHNHITKDELKLKKLISEKI